MTFNLHGELGNQMFQWATGLAYSIKHNTQVAFCTLPGVTLRLSEFKTASKFEIHESHKYDISKSFMTRISRKLNLSDEITNCQNELGLNFQELRFPNIRNFHGYFQSWRYFHSIYKTIITEFELVNPSPILHTLRQSLPPSFTGIHIRRGGSGAAILAADYHGLLDAEYYKKAIELNTKLGGAKEYVIFTDNPEQAKKIVDLIDIRDFRIIGPKDTFSQSENLLLMANATSFIGANSSYSWWAAYLNPNLETQPIFPRQWYMNPDLSNNDMLLPDWITIGFNKFLNEETCRGIHIE